MPNRFANLDKSFYIFGIPYISKTNKTIRTNMILKYNLKKKKREKKRNFNYFQFIALYVGAF